jgi:hypothetical protein
MITHLASDVHDPIEQIICTHCKPGFALALFAAPHPDSFGMLLFANRKK